MSPRVRVDRLTTEDELQKTLVAEVTAGLSADQKTVPPKYFYDARGSELFEQITALPEYYPTRAERTILTVNAARIAAEAEADCLLELGSGSAAKARVLLRGMREAGEVHSYVPVDVSVEALAGAAEELSREFEGLWIHAVAADLETGLHRLPAPGRRLAAFLGSTVGNFPTPDRARLLRQLRAALREGESLLLGADLVKSPDRLRAAYDDAAGVTAEFNRNVLRVLNKRLGADFEPEQFEHVALWNSSREQIEMRLRSQRRQRVRLEASDLTIEFQAGEDILTETSAKFRIEGMAAELEQAGFAPRRHWLDPEGDFSLWLARAE